MRRTSLTLAMLAFVFNASAAQVPYETTGFISNMQGISTPLTVSTAGDYEAKLSDLSFGGLKFDYLGMSVSTAKANLGLLETPGTLTLKMAPGLYFLNIFAKAGGIYNTGLYGVAINHSAVIGASLTEPSGTPVPLPAAGWLLLSGLTVLGWKARKQ